MSGSKSRWCNYDVVAKFKAMAVLEKLLVGKQKCHTIKAQLLVEFENGQIICTAVDKGKTHDER